MPGQEDGRNWLAHSFHGVSIITLLVAVLGTAKLFFAAENERALIQHDLRAIERRLDSQSRVLSNFRNEITRLSTNSHNSHYPYANPIRPRSDDNP